MKAREDQLDSQEKEDLQGGMDQLDLEEKLDRQVLMVLLVLLE